MSKKDLYIKIVNKLYKMVLEGEKDEIIYGNQFWEFSDRKIELIHPKKINKTKRGYKIK